MKILHLLNSFLPEYTGSTIRPYNLLSRIPYHMEILTTDRIQGTKISKKKEKYGNICVNRINLDASPIWQFPLMNQYKSLFYDGKKMINAADSIEYDIVHGHNISPFGNFARNISKKANKPFVLEMHSLEYVQGHLSPLFNSYMIKLEKILESRNLIVLTESLKKYINTNWNYNGNITVIPNGVDMKHFTRTKDYERKAENLKERMGITGKIIMYAGILDKINGIDNISKILISLIRKYEDINFIFIGHGPEADKIKLLSRKYNQIKFIPMVHYKNMPIYYALSDVFIIPRPSTISSETVTPLKLLESMAMKCKVLGSDVGGISEVIEDNKNGHLYKKDNLDDFKTQLINIIDEKDIKISKKARQTIEKHYCWEKSSSKLQEIYEKLS